MFYGVLDSRLCNFMKYNSWGGFNGKIQRLANMPSNSLPFAIFVGSEPDGFSLFGKFF
jgi:hypothetical protein